MCNCRVYLKNRGTFSAPRGPHTRHATGAGASIEPRVFSTTERIVQQVKIGDQCRLMGADMRYRAFMHTHAWGVSPEAPMA